METSAGNEERQKKFQISIGKEIVYVEVLSLKDRIYSVEFPGQEPLFITRITDLNNKDCWVSIPHGNNEVADMVGYYIEKQAESTH
jgi:hypothetical protein